MSVIVSSNPGVCSAQTQNVVQQAHVSLLRRASTLTSQRTFTVQSVATASQTAGQATNKTHRRQNVLTVTMHACVWHVHAAVDGWWDPWMLTTRISLPTTRKKQNEPRLGPKSNAPESWSASHFLLSSIVSDLQLAARARRGRGGGGYVKYILPTSNTFKNCSSCCIDGAGWLGLPWGRRELSDAADDVPRRRPLACSSVSHAGFSTWTTTHARVADTAQRRASVCV